MVDLSKQRRGLYRHRVVAGLPITAQVVDVVGGNEMDLEEYLYRQRGYEPSFDELPSQDDYFAAQQR